MSKLFKNEESDADEEEEEESLNLNTDYAKNYNEWRKKEELHKLKARYGDDVDEQDLLTEDDSESSSDDDDDGPDLSQKFDKNFFKTLACLKNKDPKIYNEKVMFVDDTVDGSKENGTQKKEKEKSLFLRDYERKLIVEKGGILSDSEDEDEIKRQEPRDPTYIEEQQAIKDTFKKVLEDEDEDDLLLPKSKTEEEKQKEDEDYKEWLKGQNKNIGEEEQKELKPLRDFWTDPNLDGSEKFLRDYILNKKFLDHESTDVDLEYNHVAHDSDENLSADEINYNMQEEFEIKHRFRFEEPDQEFIKRYPRNFEDTLRKKDTKRADKRAEVKARKEQEKLKKREELKQLKALKRKEIEEKLDKLKEITGNNDLKLDMMDLDGDFNPEEYDKKMSQIFNDNYYAEEKDEMKPEFPDIDEELEIESTWDNYDPISDKAGQNDDSYYNGPHCEDPEFNMDADCDGQKSLKDEIVESATKRKRRRRNKFSEMISKEKPKFDPVEHPSVQDYYDQYYALDYEDMIGDLPCRFKYRSVIPNNYGLTVEEILMADEKELNKWCSLKRALQYKPDHQELNDFKMYKQKAVNEALKRKILPSLYKPIEEEEEEKEKIEGKAGTSQNQEQQNSKKKRKRKRKSQINGEVTTNGSENTNVDTKSQESEKKKTKVKAQSENDETINTFENSKTESDPSTGEHKKNKKKRKLEESVDVNIETGTLKKKKKKVGEINDLEIQSSMEESQPVIKSEQSSPKKKKKNKLEINRQENQLSTEQSDSIAKSDQVSKAHKTEDKKKVQNGDISRQENLKKKNKNKHKNNENKNKSMLTKKQIRKESFKKRQKLQSKTTEADPIAHLSEERLKAYGLNPKKFKNKLKYGKKQ